MSEGSTQGHNNCFQNNYNFEMLIFLNKKLLEKAKRQEKAEKGGKGEFDLQLDLVKELLAIMTKA